MNSNNRAGIGYVSRKVARAARNADAVNASMLHINMEAFDKLPRVLREALANSDHNWSAAHVRTELRRPKAKRREQCKDAATFAASIRKMDADKHARDAARGEVAP